MAYGNLANKGRYGDTEIRNVAGRKSHVNQREASLIDALGIKGEALTQALGAGTRNPMTGLPEYHGKWGTSKNKHPRHHTLFEALNPLEHIPAGGGESIMSKTEKQISDAGDYISEGYDYWTGKAMMAGVESMGISFEDSTKDPADNFNKDEYQKALMAGTQEDYLKSIGVPENKLEYFESNIDMDQLSFIEDRYKTGSEALSLQTGKSLGDIYSQTEQVQVKSGLESSGAIDYASKKAKTGVFQDYQLQQKELQTQLASSRSGFFQGAAEEFWTNLDAADI